MISNETLQFLTELKKNNNREWFNANKPRYERTRASFVSFISDLIPRVATFDPPIIQLNAKKAIFRIYRDVRFSKDKSPYKISYSAHLVANEEKPHERAGYYIHIEPGNCLLAGGAYMPPASWLKAIREEIDHDGTTFQKLITSASFKKYFGEMEGEKLKTKPRDYPEDHPFIDLLKYKSYVAMHRLTDDDVISEGFIDHAAEVFRAIKPFEDFLNKPLL